MKPSWSTKIIIEILLFYSFYCALVLLPHLLPLYVSEIPSGRRIDPELINGLLTASSILFGVLTFVVAKQYEYLQGIEIRLSAVILISVMLFVYVAIEIFRYAIDFNMSGVMALTWAMSSLHSNAFGALYALYRLRKMK